MTYKLSILVRNAPLNERYDVTRFWTSVSAVDLFTAVTGVLGIFSSCRWFTVCVEAGPIGNVQVYDSECGFDYRFVDMLRNS